jgi:ABC-type uncharacterized transport system YnjBCD substrate-binding protein
MESIIKLIAHIMKTQTLLVLCIALIVASCSKKDDGDDTPQQTIVTTDSSGVSGRLYVDVYDVNGNDIAGATVNLYLSKDDMNADIPLYSFLSKSTGRVDFGYILQGNYYVTGKNAAGTIHDTTVAQVLPKRVLTRKLILQ